jgi:serine/threonine-protein kinase RsbW
MIAAAPVCWLGDRETMESLVVPGVLDSLGTIGKYVLEAATSAGLDRKASYRLRLAVDEIATNAITHGYEEAGLRGSLTVQAEMDEASLTLTLEDTAGAFDPRTLSRPRSLDLPLDERPIGGLGVYLTLQGVDGFRYERIGNRNRNIFTMRRPHDRGTQAPMAGVAR